MYCSLQPIGVTASGASLRCARAHAAMKDSLRGCVSAKEFISNIYVYVSVVRKSDMLNGQWARFVALLLLHTC